MRGYEFIKEMQKDLREQGDKRDIEDLIVEAVPNDPFYAGLPSQKKQAEWFVKIWKKFGAEIGVHLRGLHYKLISQKNPKTYTGRLYQNTRKDWNRLLMASKYARHLGLIPHNAIVDRRNPEPQKFTFDTELASPGWYPDNEIDEWELPTIDTDLSWDLDWNLPGFNAQGYDYYESMQPYHIEIWVEKSSMNDLLIPLCKRYNLNLVTGIGEMSIPSVVKMLERVYTRDKPCRILYISDFDPGGKNMPIAVARKVEYYLYNSQLWGQEEINIDVKLDPIILTQQQKDKYKLPRTPIKPGEKRRRRFEQIYGKGAVELDALEALHPGEFIKIVEEKILELWDLTLEDRIGKARVKIYEKLEEEWQEKIEPFTDKKNEIEEEAKEIYDKYESKLQDLRDALDAELEPLSERKKTLWHAIQKEIESTYIKIPALPRPEIEEKNNDWLFDSKRNYLEQLGIFKKAQGK